MRLRVNILLLLLTTTFVFYQSCGLVETPSGLSLASSSFKHTGLEKNCNECHNSDRPAENAKVISKNPDTLNTAFLHAQEFNGTSDCVACHTVDLNKPLLTWSDGAFNHRLVDGSELQACATCHDGNRPTSNVGMPAFNHTLNGRGDCISCHAQTTKNNVYANLQNWQGGAYFPSGLVGTGVLALNVSTPIFNFASVSSVTNVNKDFPLLMNHNSTQVAAGSSSNCVTCHSAAASGSFLGGLFHQNQATQPTACLECHSQTLPQGFVGPFDVKRNPLTGPMRHDATNWSVNVNGFLAPNATGVLASNECATCHKAPGVSFGNANYHLSLQQAGQAQPTSCVACHANSVPLGPKGIHSFNHADMNYGTAKNDCTTCHTNRIVAGVATNWLGGGFSHNPRPQTCVQCHAGQRPNTLVGTPAFNHSLNGTGDCVGCHGATNTYNSIADWAGGEEMPTDLIGSKNIAVTVGTPTFAGTTISRVTTVQAILPLQMNHYSAEFPAINSTQCITCHASSAVGNFSGGAFHKNAATRPVNCASCHINAEPRGFVGPAGPGRTPASAEMRHEAVVWSTSVGGVSTATTTKVIAGMDCAICHKSTGVTWGQTKFHSSLASAGRPQPSSCVDCHANTRPIGSVGNPPFNHQNNNGLSDCNSCHNPTAFTSLANWAGGQFSHAGVTSCLACHSAERPKSNSGWVTPGWTSVTTTFNFATHGGALDCLTCHSTVNKFDTPADWAVGNYVHPTGLTACATCHSPPAGIVGRPTPNFNHVNIGTNDCIGCHSGTPTNYTQFSGWPLGASLPAGLVNDDLTKVPTSYWLVSPTQLLYTGNLVSSTVKTLNVKLPQQILHSSNQVTNVNTCSTCHSTLPAVANTGTKYHTHGTPTTCVSCHLTNGTPVGIVGPLAATVDKVPNIDHNFKYGAGAGTTLITAAQDCAVCHTVGASWATGLFHTKVGGNPVSSCTSCHYLKMPQVSDAVNTPYTTVKGASISMHIAHKASELTSQECTTCHKQVGAAGGGGLPWANNVTYHSKIATQPTTCLSCHAGDKPANGLAQSNYDHAQIGANDCVSCHTVTASTTLWRPAAAYDHKAPYQACAACHESKAPFPRPSPTTKTQFNVLSYTPSKPQNINNGFYLHDAKYNGGPATDCMQCHANATAAAYPGIIPGLLAKVGVSWQNGFYNHTTNGTTKLGKTTCIACHATTSTFYKHENLSKSQYNLAPCLTCHR